MANKKVEKTKLKIEDFRLLKQLGSGQFSCVYLAQNKKGKYYAIKVIDKTFPGASMSKSFGRLLNERNILKDINSPYIPKLLGAFQNEEKAFMLMKLYEKGDLTHLLSKEGAVSEKQIRVYFAQLVSALGTIHEHNIVHGDIKLNNILVDKNDTIGLTDFGLAEKLEQGKTKEFVACLKYTAPELYKGEKCLASDWWAFGVTLYSTLKLSFPFDTVAEKEEGTPIGKSKPKRNYEIIKNTIVDYSDLSHHCKDLLKKLFKINPSERLGYGPNGTQQIKNHPFFKGIDWRSIDSNKKLPSLAHQKPVNIMHY